VTVEGRDSEAARLDSIERALLLVAGQGSSARVAALLESAGSSAADSERDRLDAAARDDIRRKSIVLLERGVRVTLFGDDDYPPNLILQGKPVAPLLFYMGNRALLSSSGIGMCGSRSATPLGLRAARACGLEVSRRGLAIVSGYAKGVDTATHLAALESGGSTVVVLAEGIDHFRVKREYRAAFDPERVLVVSQFAPTQPWRSYAAMERNRIIYGMGRALVVVEAGERGGTLAAGKGALRAGRPVFVLDFGGDTPPGNQELIAAGGVPIASATDLVEAIGALASAGAASQAALF
jgi:DNA processing protein